MALHFGHIPCIRVKPIDKYYASLASRHRTSSFVSSKSRQAHEFVDSRRRGMVSRLSVFRCLSSDSSRPNLSDPNKLAELPLFPLPLVLFPGSTLPLQIFEFRYRIMMHTLLQGDLRFGIIYSDSSYGTADVGCVGEVVKHERLVDDRFFIVVRGQERFRVVSIVQTKPYMVAAVQWVEDRPSVNDQHDLESLALEVETCMKDVIRLSNKLNDKKDKDKDSDIRKDLSPTPFSFFVASTFEGAPKEQQSLLELETSAGRLKRERETLMNTRNYLAAASAVRDAFQYSSFNEN